MKKFNLTIILLAVFLINAKANRAQSFSMSEQLLEILLSEDNTQEPQRYEDNDDNDERNFFSDMDKKRFESNYEGTYQRQEYTTNPSGSNYRMFENKNQTVPTFNYDMNFDFEKSYNNTQRGGISFGDGSHVPMVNQPGTGASINSGGSFGTIMPFEPPKRRDVTPENSPGLPGDPDVPLDGGIAALIAAGAAYGLRKKINNKQLNNK